MRAFLLLLLTLAGSSLAQPTSAGVGVRRSDLFTTAPVTLYVDPTGNDTKPCTGTGTAACASLAGALRKLPPTLNHNVTVNMAAGTYTLDAGVLIDSFEMATNVSLTIQGSTSYDTFTPPSGNASGTLTGFSLLSFPNRTIFTDSSQTWPAATMNSAGAMQMRGPFICMTSGPQNGNKWPIHAASPTTLETARSSFAGGNPAVGNTYTLCTPSTVITGTDAVNGLLRIGNGRGVIALNDLAIMPVGASLAAIYLNGGSTLGSRSGGFAVTANRLFVKAAGTTSIAVYLTGNYSASFTDSTLVAMTQYEGWNNSQAVSAGSTALPYAGTRFSCANCYLRGQRATAQFTSGNFAFSGATIDSENINAVGVVTVSTGSTGSFFNTWVNAYSGQFSTHSNSSCIALTRSIVTLTATSMEGCLVGLDLNFAGSAAKTPFAGFSSAANTSTLTGLRFFNIAQSQPTVGAGVMLGPGSSISFGNQAATFTTVADGNRDYVCPNTTTSYTEAAVQALPDKFFTCQGADFQR